MSARLVLGTAVAVCATGVLSVAVSGQAPGSAPPAAADNALLSEIRGLRADLAEAMSANIRAQLLVGRLQLQEQRMNTLSAQLAEVRRLLADEDSERAALIERMNRLAEDLERGPTGEIRREVESQLQRMKRELSQANPKLHELQNQEAELSRQLVSEQSRWVDFNSRLDEIEQSLPPSRGVPSR